MKLFSKILKASQTDILDPSVEPSAAGHLVMLLRRSRFKQFGRNNIQLWQLPRQRVGVLNQKSI